MPTDKEVIEVSVKSAVIDWLAGNLEVTDRDGGKHTILLDTPIHVTMIGYPEREERDMRARDLGDYMSRGYILETMRFEGEG